ncbi:unnamed protein product [Gadus morhua 'NCC']
MGCLHAIAAKCHTASPTPPGLLGMLTTWPSPQTVLQAFQRPGKRPVAHIDGTVRTPGTLSSAVDAKDGGAQQHRRGRGAPLPPEADDNTESTMVTMKWA